MIDFKYNKEKELYIFNRFKDDLPDPSASMMLEELEEVDVSKETSTSVIRKAEKDWLEVRESFLCALGDFYQEKLESPELDCWLGRFYKFPYYYEGEAPWFAAPLFSSPARRNNVIMHELCHFYQPMELDRAIKEAIPEILNDHHRFKMYWHDTGHDDEDEQRWRKIIWKGYKEGKSLQEILVNNGVL